MYSENGSIPIDSFKIICRLCGEQSKEMTKLNLRKKRHRNLKDSIRKYIGININSGDGFPEQICISCVNKVDETAFFICTCIRIHHVLKTAIQDNISKPKSEVLYEKSYMKGLNLNEEETLYLRNMVTSVLEEPERNKGASEKLHINNKDFAGCKNQVKDFESLLDNVSEKKLPLSSAEIQSSSNSPAGSSSIGGNEGIGDPSSFSDDTIKKESFPMAIPSMDSEKSKSAKEAKEMAFDCAQCGLTEDSDAKLKLHIEKVHEDKMEKCPKCDKNMSSSYLWAVHMHSHDERQFQCDICHANYSDPITLRMHQEVHSVDNQKGTYTCGICNKVLSCKTSIYYHIKRHTGGTPFACDQCGKSYRTKGGLNNHYRVHTGKTPYVCHICGKKYSEATPLKTHLRSHTGVRPYACSICNKTFSTNFVLRRHTLTHTGILPYPCSHCGKRFRDIWKRKEHERTHTGERPYKCPFCSSAFYQSGNLKSHCKNVHKQDYAHPPMDSDDAGDQCQTASVAGLQFGTIAEEAIFGSIPLLGHTIFSEHIDRL